MFVENWKTILVVLAIVAVVLAYMFWPSQKVKETSTGFQQFSGNYSTAVAALNMCASELQSSHPDFYETLILAGWDDQMIDELVGHC